MYLTRLRKPAREAFEKLLKEDGVTEIKGLNNPVRIMGDTTVVYLMYKDELHECFIDTEDLPKIALNCTWVATGRKTTDVLYARAGIKNSNGAMHRTVLNCNPNGVIDHIDNNGLNNKKNNLWDTNDAMNLYKRRGNKNNKSGERNITYMNGWYKVQLIIRFKHKDIATKARDAAKEIIKEYVALDAENRYK